MTAYQIEPLQGGPRVLAEPVAGRWYVGVTAAGESGAVVKYDGAFFVNSDKPDEPGYPMEKYPYLRELV